MTKENPGSTKSSDETSGRVLFLFEKVLLDVDRKKTVNPKRRHRLFF